MMSPGIRPAFEKLLPNLMSKLLRFWGDYVPQWGDYVPTRFAKHGDVGSLHLPIQPSGTVWKAGGVAEVVWQIGANHGGGYAYRLCPLGEALTEACFQDHPLPFDQTKQALLFPNGTRLPILSLIHI